MGINGQLAVCFSKLLGFIKYNISVYCKLAQWRVADPRGLGGGGGEGPAGRSGTEFT